MNRRGGLDAPVVLVRSDGDPRRHRALGNRPVDAAAVTGDRVAAPRSARDDRDGGGGVRGPAPFRIGRGADPPPPGAAARGWRAADSAPGARARWPPPRAAARRRDRRWRGGRTRSRTRPRPEPRRLRMPSLRLRRSRPPRLGYRSVPPRFAPRGARDGR